MCVCVGGGGGASLTFDEGQVMEGKATETVFFSFLFPAGVHICFGTPPAWVCASVTPAVRLPPPPPPSSRPCVLKRRHTRGQKGEYGTDLAG